MNGTVLSRIHACTHCSCAYVTFMQFYSGAAQDGQRRATPVLCSLPLWGCMGLSAQLTICLMILSGSPGGLAEFFTRFYSNFVTEARKLPCTSFQRVFSHSDRSGKGVGRDQGGTAPNTSKARARRMYAFMHVYHIRINIYIYIYIHIYVYIVYICTCTYTEIDLCVCIYVHMHTHIQVDFCPFVAGDCA